ncbi:hypothetical protein [Euzebya pacifica]|jgi:hypothetical protein|uniref:hypothetical protein n=1 Tax=Euzebya pacifica TaxID=1608957 RepID=UPI0030F5B33C
MTDASEVIERLRSELDAMDDLPVAEHVKRLTRTLDTIVGELDELARTIPPAR